MTSRRRPLVTPNNYVYSITVEVQRFVVDVCVVTLHDWILAESGVYSRGTSELNIKRYGMCVVPSHLNSQAG